MSTRRHPSAAARWGPAALAADLTAAGSPRGAEVRVKTCCTKAIFKKCAKRRLPPALCYVFGHDFTVGVKGHVTVPDCYFTSDAMALRLSSCASKRSVVFKAPRASSRQRTREVRRSKFTGGLGQRLDLKLQAKASGNCEESSALPHPIQLQRALEAPSFPSSSSRSNRSKRGKMPEAMSRPCAMFTLA